jgi:hypothetical protein
MSKAPAATLAGYTTAVNSLGVFTTARGMEGRFGAGRHDGAAAYQDLVFDAGCGCMGFSGPRRAVQ